MASILIKDVPDGLHAKLKARAQQKRRSMAKELLEILAGTLDDRAGPPSLAEIDRLRVSGARPLTQDVLDTALRRARR